MRVYSTFSGVLILATTLVLASCKIQSDTRSSGTGNTTFASGGIPVPILITEAAPENPSVSVNPTVVPNPGDSGTIAPPSNPIGSDGGLILKGPPALQCLTPGLSVVAGDSVEVQFASSNLPLNDSLLSIPTVIPAGASDAGHLSLATATVTSDLVSGLIRVTYQAPQSVGTTGFIPVTASVTAAAYGFHLTDVCNISLVAPVPPPPVPSLICGLADGAEVASGSGNLTIPFILENGEPGIGYQFSFQSSPALAGDFFGSLNVVNGTSLMYSRPAYLAQDMAVIVSLASSPSAENEVSASCSFRVLADPPIVVIPPPPAPTLVCEGAPEGILAGSDGVFEFLAANGNPLLNFSILSGGGTLTPQSDNRSVVYHAPLNISASTPVSISASGEGLSAVCNSVVNPKSPGDGGSVPQVACGLPNGVGSVVGGNAILVPFSMTYAEGISFHDSVITDLSVGAQLGALTSSAAGAVYSSLTSATGYTATVNRTLEVAGMANPPSASCTVRVSPDVSIPPPQPIAVNCSQGDSLVLDPGQTGNLAFNVSGGNSGVALTFSAIPSGLISLHSLSNQVTSVTAPKPNASEQLVTVRGTANDGSGAFAECKVLVTATGQIGTPYRPETDAPICDVYTTPLYMPHLPQIYPGFPGRPPKAPTVSTEVGDLNYALSINLSNFSKPNEIYTDGFPGVAVLDPRTHQLEPLIEFFMMFCEGDLIVDPTGLSISPSGGQSSHSNGPQLYPITFKNSSDDGSMFYLDGVGGQTGQMQLVVNNDGIHAVEDQSTTVNLPAGRLRFAMQFTQQPRFYIANMLFWKWGSSGNFALIPPTSFKRPSE